MKWCGARKTRSPRFALRGEAGAAVIRLRQGFGGTGTAARLLHQPAYSARQTRAFKLS